MLESANMMAEVSRDFESDVKPLNPWVGCDIGGKQNHGQVLTPPHPPPSFGQCS